MRSVSLSRVNASTLELALRSVSVSDRRILCEPVAYWLGSVYAGNQDAVNEFIGLAREQRFKEMVERGSLELDLVYGLLVQDEADPASHWVGAFRKNTDLWEEHECLMWEPVNDIEVIEKHVLDSKVPKCNWRPGWRDVLSVFVDDWSTLVRALMLRLRGGGAGRGGNGDESQS